ncbi:MAG: hypothetical protein VKN72_20080 [Nostocales cyanobacterium 94392]|nr:hypothetical protein [Nostocales cyanobacterium 94392]
MSNWAPIVFGRTYEVDFRFIAIPVDLTAKEKNWLQQYILVTTRSPERLREDPPRWSVIKKDDICVVGVTCMAAAFSQDMTMDNKHRSLYLFVGYLSRSPFPELPPMDIEQFQPLYKYIGEKWNEKPYDTSRHEPILNQYQFTLSGLTKTLNSDDEYFSLNQTNSEIVRVWPEEENNRENLWQAASKAESVSLCLGLASKKDTLKSCPFLNIVAADVRQKEDLSKVISLETTIQGITATTITTGSTTVLQLSKPDENKLPVHVHNQHHNKTNNLKSNNSHNLGFLALILGLFGGGFIGEEFNIFGLFAGALIGLVVAILLVGAWFSKSDNQGKMMPHNNSEECRIAEVSQNKDKDMALKKKCNSHNISKEKSQENFWFDPLKWLPFWK